MSFAFSQSFLYPKGRYPPPKYTQKLPKAGVIERTKQLDGDMQAELCCEQCGALLREPVLVGATGATVCAGCAPPGEECAPNALVATIVGRFDLKSATR